MPEISVEDVRREYQWHQISLYTHLWKANNTSYKYPPVLFPTLNYIEPRLDHIINFNEDHIYYQIT